MRLYERETTSINFWKTTNLYQTWYLHLGISAHLKKKLNSMVWVTSELYRPSDRRFSRVLHTQFPPVYLPYVWSWTPHGMCWILLSDTISTCQRSRKKSAPTALTTATASVHTLTTSSYPYSSHLTSGDCDDSYPTICLLDSSVLVVIVISL
jgi:hypothetical protein